MRGDGVKLTFGAIACSPRDDAMGSEGSGGRVWRVRPDHQEIGSAIPVHSRPTCQRSPPFRSAFEAVGVEFIERGVRGIHQFHTL